MGARDPYCGWDLLLKKCTTLEESVRMSQWEQSISKCPVSITEPLPNLYIVVHCSSLSCYYSHFPLCPCFQTLNLVENTIILTLPPCSLYSPYEFNTDIHLCFSPPKACSVFSPYTHNLQAPTPKNSLGNTSLPEKSILGLNNLT